MSGPAVVLIGPPGAGKSTVGHALADILGVGFHDTDAAIEVREGRSIADIFVIDGEPAFRQLESAEVAAAIAQERGVLALGGGAPMSEQAQEALADCLVVFLDVGIADAAPRIGFDQSRPLLAVNPRASWVRLMKERRPTYERLARHIVDTSGRSAQQVAAEIADLVGASR